MDQALGYLAYNLTSESAERLCRAFPPHYERLVCHHVTVVYGVPDSTPLLPAPASLLVVGYLDDGHGLEALIVEVDGSQLRPDSGTFHITHSLGTRRTPVESNYAIQSCGWTALMEPIQIAAIPGWNRIEMNGGGSPMGESRI